MVCLKKSLCLIDWVTVSALVPFSELLNLFGLCGLAWSDSGSGSKLRYGHRISCGGISMHYTDETDCFHNPGCCLEMSGQGCREFEDVSSIEWIAFFETCQSAGFKITRLDLAYDDRNNHFPVIDLERMSKQAIDKYFTARSRKHCIIVDSELGSSDSGISVCHGSRSSEVYIRFYDKRVERRQYDQCRHWVRAEIQLRGSACIGVVNAFQDMSIGELFRGVMSKYLQYRECNPSDSNPARWQLSPWWVKFLDHAAGISVCEKVESEYNKGRLDSFVYDHCYNAIAAEILSDGLPVVLSRILSRVSSSMPAKYQKLLPMSDSDRVLILDSSSLALILEKCAPELADFLDFNAIST